MPDNYVLIDFENVQPKNLDILANHPFRVFVFVGANQTKIPIELAEAMQHLGDRGKYIRISGNGKNALDFHLAYYLGELISANPEAYFHIISKDTGFDLLVKHLRSRKLKIQRESDLTQIPVLKMSNARSNDEKIDAIVKNLAGRGQSRPRKLKTLSNTINSLFTEHLQDAELMSLIELLKQKKFISLSEENVSYKLPN